MVVVYYWIKKTKGTAGIMLANVFMYNGHYSCQLSFTEMSCGQTSHAEPEYEDIVCYTHKNVENSTSNITELAAVRNEAYSLIIRMNECPAYQTSTIFRNIH